MCFNFCVSFYLRSIESLPIIIASYVRPPLIQRKFIRILEDFIPIEIFPTKPFELKEWTLWNPIKFLWNASSYTSFGGILTRDRTSWKKSLESLSLLKFLCFSCSPIKRSFLRYSYVLQSSVLHLHSCLNLILCFSYSSVFSFIWFKGALRYEDSCTVAASIR